MNHKEDKRSALSEQNMILDIHTHTCASGHAFGTIREMALAAKERGLLLLGVSEHAPGVPGTCDPIYFSNLWVAPRQLYGVEIIHGCEINVLNDGTLSLERKFMEKLDYGIVGIHRTCYQDAGMDKNTDNLISCMKDEKVFFVSHPDDDHTPLDYERLVAAARKYHVALELNNSSLLKPNQRLNCVQNYKQILRLCRNAQWPIIINSDAHDPNYVGRFSEALALLEEEDFPAELILNRDVNTFKSFLGR
ncbi:MAG: phosphatase [Lachnospiraceae bacterium]|nr:phosphatase [Lachnospiraceae bacterium]